MQGEVLIVLTITIIANSQLLNIRDVDDQLFQIHTNLGKIEKQIAKWMKSERSQLQTVQKKISYIPKLQSTVNDTINLYRKFMTVANFPPYRNISTCDDINIKITTIEMDIRKFVHLQSSSSINATFLQTQVNLMAIYMTVNLKSLPSSLNFQLRIENGNKIVCEFLNYIKILSLAISTQAQINANLKAYKSSYCISQSSLSGNGQKTISTLEQNVAFLESELFANQIKIIATTKEAKFTYIRIYGDTARNLSFLNLYTVGVNSSIIVNNSTFDGQQRKILINLSTCLTKLVNLFVKHLSDVAYSIARTAEILSKIRVAGDEFCGCQSVSDETTFSQKISTKEQVTTTSTKGLATTSKITRKTTTTTKELQKTSANKKVTAGIKSTSLKFNLERFTTRPTTTTTLKATTTPVYSETCGEFIKFEPDFNPNTRENRPDIYGFAGGFDFDGSTQYVGYGDDRCGLASDYVGPVNRSGGYILTKLSSAGARICCQLKGQYVDRENAYYLLNNKNLEWVQTNGFEFQTGRYEMTTESQILRAGSGKKKFMFGRVKYQREYLIGKVQFEDLKEFWSGFYMTDENKGTKYYESGFEILTCSQCKNGGTGTFCCLNGANNIDCCLNGGSGKNCEVACGTFVPYDSNNNIKAPEIYGFQSGISYKDNVTKKYVGYGYCGDDGVAGAGKIETTPTKPGCLIPCATEEIGVFEYDSCFYLLSHPKLTWVKTNLNSIMQIPGTIKITGEGNYPFMIGRAHYRGNYEIGNIDLKPRQSGFYIIDQDGKNLLFEDDFEVLTCYTPLREKPCGTFVPYDTVNDVKAPVIYGFQGGVSFKDNVTEQYVGYGSDCGGVGNPVPCYIDTTPTKPGCFMSCDLLENYDNKKSFYLISHPKLTWVKTNENSILKIPGQVKGKGLFETFGRALYKGNYQVGKISYERMYFEGEEGQISLGNNFEVLTCYSPPSSESPCGTFVPYDTVNDVKAPEVYGFQGGINYKDNVTKQYVGYGSSCGNQDPVPCYIDTIQSGCFISCGNHEIIDNETSFYLLSHPNLIWTSIDSRISKITPKNVMISGGGKKFLFGRIFYEGNFRLGKIDLDERNYEFKMQGPEGKIKFLSGFDFLSCASSVKNPCGTFYPYDVEFERDAPEYFGFQGGIRFSDNVTKQYVGYAVNKSKKYEFSKETDENILPCVINIAQDKAGCYMFAKNFKNVKNISAYFLLSHPQITWIRNDQNYLRNIREILPQTDDFDQPLIGRISYRGNYRLGEFSNNYSENDQNFFSTGAPNYQRFYNKYEYLACGPVLNAPCGTFVLYNTINTVKAPKLYGFEGGISFKDNLTKQFVGYAQNGCHADNSVPCGIETSSTNSGCYLTCAKEEIFKKHSVFYLLSHPELNWKQTNISKINSANPLFIKGENYDFYFTRILYQGHYRLGKINATADVLTMNLQVAKNSIKEFESFEILSCDVENVCGTFHEYFSSDENIKDFDAAVHSEECVTKLYVGYGKSCDEKYEFMPCFATTDESGFGCHLLCDWGEEVLEGNFYLLYENKNLNWIKTDGNLVKNVSGTLKLSGKGLPLMYGRALYKGCYKFGIIQAFNGVYNFQMQGPQDTITLIKRI